MSDDDNVISITKRLKERQLQQSGGDWPDPVPLHKPTLSEVDSFMRVLTFIQQQSPDGTGEITFDNFVAKVAIDGNRLDMSEDALQSQVRQAVVIEALFPIACTSMEDADKVFDNEITFKDIVFCAHYIICRLNLDEK